MQREQTGSSSSILEPSDIYKTRNPNSSFLTLCPQQQLAKPLSFVHAQYIVPTRSETTYQYAIAKRLVTPFTHLRGVRLALLEQVSRASKVSIHAPARGATVEGGECAYEKVVSIHAPTRGATGEFVSHLHTVVYVSIHAPTRGATAARHRGQSGERRFNSRTHEGCDTASFTCPRRTCSFNSRTHEGCDTSP